MTTNVTTFNRSHNMELVKLDKKIRSAIDDALKQDHTKLSAAEIVGVLECVKFQLLLEEA